MSGDGRAIGIFDSGIGGLTVLHEIAGLLPKEELVYLGDTARVPYGTKSKETIVRYSLENARFLLSKNVKAIVVACNSAAATSIAELEESFDLPIVGVIEAGVEEAMQNTKTGKIGVIGTHATIQSGRYEKLLIEKGAKQIITNACPLFVPLAEEGWTDNSIAEEVARIYLEPFTKGAVDCLILGCTHYPLLQKVIAGACGDGVTLVNSARAVAKRLEEELKRGGLMNENGKGGRSYFVTDSPERARLVGGRFLGEDLSNKIELAELS